MQVQARQFELSGGVVSVALQVGDVGVHYLVQVSEIQPQLIDRQAEQATGGMEADGLILVFQQRAEQHAALTFGDEPDYRIDRGMSYLRLVTVQIGAGQFERLRTGVIVQLGIQRSAALRC